MANNPVVIIIGASRGIGQSLSEYFASKQYDLILIARDANRLQQWVDTLKSSYHVNILHFAINVADYQAVKQTMQIITASHPRIDVLINNAGIVNYGTSAIEPQQFQELLNVNLNGVYNWIHEVTPIMKQQQAGYIFNISSRSAILPNPQTGAYAMTKAGVKAYSEALARELHNDHIKVTAICPGAVATDMTKNRDIDGALSLSPDDLVKTVDYCLTLSKNARVTEVFVDSMNSPLTQLKVTPKPKP